MKQTINFSQFRDAFSDTYKNNFTYAGKRALFDYLENIEEETGEAVELDTVALCCEYTEYESALEAWREHAGYQTPEQKKASPLADITEEEALAYLEENTTVIPVDNGGVIILQF